MVRGITMDIETYSKLAIRTAKCGIARDSIIHASLGIGGEAGEVLDHVKKVVFNDRDLDIEHIVAEIGDILWYINLMLYTVDVSWSIVLDKNIAKLETRYPDLKYDADRSLNRDVAAEKAAMRAV
jgi:NTP pyrophosphatase (non-canonical NTP hydrolase)